MKPEYRIRWKNKDGGRYATEVELDDIYLGHDGRVYKYVPGQEYINDEVGGVEYFEHMDITDDVVVEMWIEATDNESIPPKKIYDGDKLLVGYEDCEQDYDEAKDEYVDSEIYIVQYQIEMQYPAFDLVPLPGEKSGLTDCECNSLASILHDGRCKVVGNIHDNESEAENV